MFWHPGFGSKSSKYEPKLTENLFFFTTNLPELYFTNILKVFKVCNPTPRSVHHSLGLLTLQYIFYSLVEFYPSLQLIRSLSVWYNKKIVRDRQDFG